jgi:hypothetical protein
MAATQQQPSFISGDKVTFVKSARYIGKASDVANIETLFKGLLWPPTTVTVYITNGWHESFEVRGGQGMMVTYCGFCINYDIDTYKQHYYI